MCQRGECLTFNIHLVKIKTQFSWFFSTSNSKGKFKIDSKINILPSENLKCENSKHYKMGFIFHDFSALNDYTNIFQFFGKMKVSPSQNLNFENS